MTQQKNSPVVSHHSDTHAVVHLSWKDGTRLCHGSQYEPSHYWPKWNSLTLGLPDTCALCAAIYTKGYNRHWEEMTRLQANVAA